MSSLLYPLFHLSFTSSIKAYKTDMGGPNLEIFKFGFYLFTPIYVMLKFGDPEWYDDYVRPYKELFWPPYESTHQPPKTHAAIKEELARMKAERIAKKAAQLSQAEGTETVQGALAAEKQAQGDGAGETKWNKFGAAGHGRLV
ncbi:hypothetical protein C366_00795 [Cryptococcus neoformans Tu401-1]|nr:hypothetical protein C365_00791 [Cryptococcus neoformans var. grubii Bt85]OXG23414.1 hypothetical protein C366_00795 [Cryptococcus neoformans var. grubii Tu401-1]OXM81822.1 hypothetical protein C364_00795 [Cryptococcus neoformans var. grubii Bt63]